MLGGLSRDAIQSSMVTWAVRSMGDGREVEHGVGGAAKGHVEHHAVMDRLLVQNLTGCDVLLHQLHDLHARLLGKADALGEHSGDGAVTRKRQTQRLGKTADGVLR